MSRPRYWWYGNVLRIIGEYPRLASRSQDMSSNASADGLSAREQEDYAAVCRAVKEAGTWRDGSEVLAVVTLHAWGDKLSFGEIGRAMFISSATAKGRYKKFVYETARQLGYKKFG
nr:MAG TPA: RNA polymerase sigma-H factor [Caudoviricetes sp.]